MSDQIDQIGTYVDKAEFLVRFPFVSKHLYKGTACVKPSLDVLPRRMLTIEPCTHDACTAEWPQEERSQNVKHCEKIVLLDSRGRRLHELKQKTVKRTPARFNSAYGTVDGATWCFEAGETLGQLIVAKLKLVRRVRYVLSIDINNKGEQEPFLRVVPSRFNLISWLEEIKRKSQENLSVDEALRQIDSL